MRFLDVLKTLLTPLLALLLLAACVAPLPAPSAHAPLGAVTISLGASANGYGMQHLEEEIHSIVFGLMDLSAQPELGYADGDPIPSGHAYHAAIAGTGVDPSGLMAGVNGSDNVALTAPQRADRNRYLYVVSANKGTRSVTFNQVKPSASPRYLAFAVAFRKDPKTSPVTTDDAIGFVKSDAFAVDAQTPTTLPAMNLALTRGLGSVVVGLTIAEQDFALTDMSRVIVALVDAHATPWTPSFGYEASAGGTVPLVEAAGNPPYHAVVTGGGAKGFNFAPTPIAASSAAHDQHKRYFYYSLTPADFGGALTKTIRFDNLRPGTKYYAFAIAFAGATYLASDVRGKAQSPDGGIEVPHSNPNTPLNLSLTN